jgi:predicted permease
VLTGSVEAEAVVTFRASADFLPILGLSPTLGRGFTSDDDVSGGPRTALLSEAFFRSRFGADPGTIGKTIVLNHVPHTVIGVVPDAPVFIQRAQVYVPLAWTAEERGVRNNHNYLGIAKLRRGIDVARANADMTAISRRLEAAYPEDNTDWGALVVPLQQDMISDVRQSLLVLLGAVALVLLIACANLANLMLVRTHGRAKEIALRAALGAGRLRIIQQLLAEGLVLGVGGGLAGLAAAYYAVDVLKVTFSTALPRSAEVAVDTRVLAFTAAVALATGLLSAFVPAWQLTRRDAHDALKTGASRGNSSAGDSRIRRLLVMSEVALALMLLIGAGLLMRSLSGLRSVDPGFDPSNVLTASLNVPQAKYATPEQRNQFFDRALQNVRALPGVVSAGWIDTLPLQGGSSQYVVVDGMPPMKEAELPVVAVRLPSPGYFATARIQLRAGRDFNDGDGYGKPRVVIVSENTAQRFWPGQNPLGKRVTLTMMTKEPAEVVGVVREVKTGTLDASEADSETAIYAPAAQFAFNGATLALRTVGDPRTLTRSMVNAIQAVDPEVPVLDITTLDEVVEESLGQRPLAMLLLAGFAVLALVLASVGVYSVLAYTVRQRVREIGIRMALGAPVRRVLRLVVLEGLKPTIAGVAVGLVLAAVLGRVLRSLLFGVSQYDPRTFAAVALMMLAVGALATLIPAWRAARVDPVVTLRAE